MTVQNGFAIRAFRKIAGLSVADMAERLGPNVSEQHYRKIEAETRNAKAEHIVVIAKAVNVTPAALVRTPPGTPTRWADGHNHDVHASGCGPDCPTLSVAPGNVTA